MRYRLAHSHTLDLFLALQRELAGRDSWEQFALSRPVSPEVHRFHAGCRQWAASHRGGVPGWVASADGVDGLRPGPGEEHLAPATELVASALHAASPELEAAVASAAAEREAAAAELRRLLDPASYLGPLCSALGTTPSSRSLALHLVPRAPHPPAAGFLTDRDSAGGSTDVGLYLDFGRFRGSTLADSALILLGWAQLRAGRGPEHLSVRLAALLPGQAPYQRRLRVLLNKILVELTAGHLVGTVDPAHRPCAEVLGSRWRFPRLYAVAERHWTPYLDGDADRAGALGAMAAELSARSPRWYVDHVDAASLAADFYLLEFLRSAGDDDAGRRLARWLPQLSADLADHLDAVIGNELGHYERVRTERFPEPLAGFLRQVTEGDSRAAWIRLRRSLGSVQALRLAEEAFAGPGIEFGGEAWAPIAAMMRRYVRHELPEQVFVDQCFSLEHNNGSLFDKYFDVEDVRAVLDAQAATDLPTLVDHASAEVRSLWRRHRRRGDAEYDPRWLGRTGAAETVPGGGRGWFELSVREAPPGALGCGNRADPATLGPGNAVGTEERVRVRRLVARRPFPATLRTYRSVSVTMRTGLGPVTAELWPESAPYTVDNFVGLATGTRAWTDPLTGEPRQDRFYDGIPFFRRVPGFLVQSGDRLGTGEGGPGYRIPHEGAADRTFEQPFRLAMANFGRDGTGSQFFVTLASAPHLDGEFTPFGEVRDAASRRVVTEIAGSAGPVILHTMTVEARG